MNIAVFCAPGFERGTFALDVLDYFWNRHVEVKHVIGISTGFHAAAFFAAGATKEGIEEFKSFDMMRAATPYPFLSRMFSPHTLPSLVSNRGMTEIIRNAIEKYNLEWRIRNNPNVWLECIMFNICSGKRYVLHCRNYSLVDILSTCASAGPVWPPFVAEHLQLVDGVFAPSYFLNDVLENRDTHFVICRGDPPGPYVPIKPLRSWMSTHMRVLDLIAEQKIDSEINTLKGLGLGERAFSLLHAPSPLVRKGLFNKTPEDVAANIEAGRSAAESFCRQKLSLY